MDKDELRIESERAHAFEVGKGWALRLGGAESEQVKRVAALDATPLKPPGGYVALATAVTGNQSPPPSLVQETMAALFDVAAPTHAELLGFVGAVDEVYGETLLDVTYMALWRPGPDSIN